MIYEKNMIRRNVHEHRKDVRSVYSEGYGQKELFNIFHDAGLFRIIKPEELDARNRAILKAEEIGMLDEGIVRTMIGYFFSLPLDEMENKKVLEGERNMQYDVYENHEDKNIGD